MPKMSGTEVCRILRAESIVPIIMLTAKDGEVDRVLGLELGADDYVTKPFSVRELASRIRAVLRRRELERSASEMVVRAGDVEIDLSSHKASVAGREVHLTPSEFKILALLAGPAGAGVQPLADHGASLGGVVRRHGAGGRRPRLEPAAQDRGRPGAAAADRHDPGGGLQACGRGHPIARCRLACSDSSTNALSSVSVPSARLGPRHAVPRKTMLALAALAAPGRALGSEITLEVPA